jgi:hypothetical protein
VIKTSCSNIAWFEYWIMYKRADMSTLPLWKTITYEIPIEGRYEHPAVMSTLWKTITYKNQLNWYKILHQGKLNTIQYTNDYKF